MRRRGWSVTDLYASNGERHSSCRFLSGDGVARMGPSSHGVNCSRVEDLLGAGVEGLSGDGDTCNNASESALRFDPNFLSKPDLIKDKAFADRVVKTSVAVFFDS